MSWPIGGLYGEFFQIDALALYGAFVDVTAHLRSRGQDAVTASPSTFPGLVSPTPPGMLKTLLIVCTDGRRISLIEGMGTVIPNLAPTLQLALYGVFSDVSSVLHVRHALENHERRHAQPSRATTTRLHFTVSNTALRCEPVPGTKKALLVLVHGGLGGAARVSYAEEGSPISVDFAGSVHKNTQEPCSIM